jgi:hypothetical protein
VHLTTPTIRENQAEALCNVIIFMKWTDDIRDTGQPLSKLEKEVRKLAQNYFKLVFWDPDVKKDIKKMYENTTYRLDDKSLKVRNVMQSLYFLYNHLQ